MTQNTIDLAGGLVAALFIIVTFAISIVYELRHGDDDNTSDDQQP